MAILATGGPVGVNMNRLVRWGYAGFLRLLLPAYLFKLWWRGRQEPLYRFAIKERFGFYDTLPTSGWVWVHAVSLGETRAAVALVDALRAQQPGLRLLLTHGTATGKEAGRALLAAGDIQTWLPYDSPGATARFFQQFQPVIGVLMETEIWPNLLHAATQSDVPMVLANARLSAKSQRQGERFSMLLKPAVRSLAWVLAQTQDDADRYLAIGAPHVQVCGNLKFDMPVNAALLAQGRAWRALSTQPVLLAASTREGEEAQLLQAWCVQPEATRGRLLIVPRHPQRFDEVAVLLQNLGLRSARRSQWGTGPTEQALNAQVWLGDSVGEMALYYALADVALLGGSFAPLGGQNLIEAAACGCPVVMGPHTFNFAQAAELALGAGAALRVTDAVQGVQRACQLLGSSQRQTLATQALAFAQAHRGAAARMADCIEGGLRNSLGTNVSAIQNDHHV
jgi:3-deoxy-D-manno-octulosonic-acid transferase